MKELILVKHGDCIVPLSHGLNKDGYFRKSIGGKMIMYHRYIWEQANGVLPVGFEIDHMCTNRACCNIEHLQALSGMAHRIESNQFRYSALREYAKLYWEANTVTGTELAEEFKVSISSACKWIRAWKLKAF